MYCVWGKFLKNGGALRMKADKKICTNCKFENTLDSKFCMKCGTKLKVKFCEYCGGILLDDDVFCVKCGKSVKAEKKEVIKETAPVPYKVPIEDVIPVEPKPSLNMNKEEKSKTYKLKISMDSLGGSTAGVSEEVSEYFSKPSDL